jgi:hypothetical protein
MKEQGSTTGQQATGFGSSRTGSQPLDARYSEDVHTIADRLRPMASADSNLIVIGQKQDGSPFLWATGDKQVTADLAKQVAPELVFDDNQ